MKQGKTLNELAAELDRQRNAKKDYLVQTDAIEMVERDNGGVSVTVDGLGNFGINDVAHSQLGTYLGIPAAYYERMRSFSPSLLAHNVNHWLANAAEPERRMLRTMDGSVRAFLSDKYRRIDNYEVADTVLPLLLNVPDLEVKSCEITEKRMYIKAVTPRIQGEVSVGDVVQSGIVISNSEVGLGSVAVSPLIFRLVCTNGMIAQESLRKIHSGRGLSADGYNIYRDETIEADDKAFLMKVEDTVNAALDGRTFERILGEMRQSKERKIGGAEVPKVVELTSKRLGITQSESSGILGHLIEGGDLSQYGLANAVTRYSQDVQNYDRATELEAVGYRIITMAPALWNSINAAARE